MTNARRTAELLLDALVTMPAGESVELDQLTDLLLERGTAQQQIVFLRQHFLNRTEHGNQPNTDWCIYMMDYERHGLMEKLK